MNKQWMVFLIGILVISQTTLSAQMKKKAEMQNSSVIKVKGLYPNDQFRVSADPLRALIGFLLVKGEYFINQQFAVGADVVYGFKQTSTEKSTSDAKSYKTSYLEYNLGLNYMLSGVNTSDGFYLNTRLGRLRSAISDYSDLKLSGDTTTNQLVVTGGYQWVYEKRLQLKLGLGARSLQTADIVIYDESKKEVYRESANLSSVTADVLIAYSF
ncbi:MAG: hypothetical protein ACK4VO_10020 [Pseudobdellovibrio sp.]